MRRPTRIRSIALIALAAFIANLLFPLWAPYGAPPLSARAALQTASATDTQVLICTPQGLKWVSIDGTGEPGAPSSPAESLQCAFCCSFSHGVKCFTPACHGTVVYTPASYSVSYEPRFESAGKARILVLGRTVRGPPHTA